MEPISGTKRLDDRRQKYRWGTPKTQAERWAQEAAEDFAFYEEHPDWPPEEPPNGYRGRNRTRH